MPRLRNCFCQSAGITKVVVTKRHQRLLCRLVDRDALTSPAVGRCMTQALRHPCFRRSAPTLPIWLHHRENLLLRQCLPSSAVYRAWSGAMHDARKGSTRWTAKVQAAIRCGHGRPRPPKMDAVPPQDSRDMPAKMPFDWHGMCSRAMLLIGIAGVQYRSGIFSLDHGKEDGPDSGRWVQIMVDSALIIPRGKTGWCKIEILCGFSEQTCPVHALTS